jgi:hypothetical protein
VASLPVFAKKQQYPDESAAEDSAQKMSKSNFSELSSHFFGNDTSFQVKI